MAGQSKTLMKSNVASLINDNTTGDITPADLRNALNLLIDNLENLIAEEIVVVKTAADLPTPSAGNITLNRKAYLIAAPLSLASTLVLSMDTAIFALSPVQGQLTYTGTGNMFESSDYTISLTNLRLTMTAAATFGSFSNPTDSLNSFIIKDCIVNGSDVAQFGIVSDFFSVFIQNSSFTQLTNGAVVDGVIDSATLFSCLLQTGGTAFALSTATINRSRLTNNIFNVTAGAVGIDRQSGVVANALWNDNFFSGAGTYLVGVNHTLPTVWFDSNRGIQNSAVLGSYVMVGNAVVTDIVTQGVPVKVAGTSTPQKLERMTHSNNRLTWTSSEPGTATVSLSAQMSKVGGGTQSCTMRLFKNGAPLPVAVRRNVSGLSNAGANVTLFAEVDMVSGDYIEPYVEGVDGTNDILVSNCIIIVQGN